MVPLHLLIQGVSADLEAVRSISERAAQLHEERAQRWDAMQSALSALMNMGPGRMLKQSYGESPLPQDAGALLGLLEKFEAAYFWWDEEGEAVCAEHQEWRTTVKTVQFNAMVLSDMAAEIIRMSSRLKELQGMAAVDGPEAVKMSILSVRREIMHLASVVQNSMEFPALEPQPPHHQSEAPVSQPTASQREEQCLMLRQLSLATDPPVLRKEEFMVGQPFLVKSWMLKYKNRRVLGRMCALMTVSGSGVFVVRDISTFLRSAESGAQEMGFHEVTGYRKHVRFFKKFCKVVPQYENIVPKPNHNVLSGAVLRYQQLGAAWCSAVRQRAKNKFETERLGRLTERERIWIDMMAEASELTVAPAVESASPSTLSPATAAAGEHATEAPSTTPHEVPPGTVGWAYFFSAPAGWRQFSVTTKLTPQAKWNHQLRQEIRFTDLHYGKEYVRFREGDATLRICSEPPTDVPEQFGNGRLRGHRRPLARKPCAGPSTKRYQTACPKGKSVFCATQIRCSACKWSLKEQLAAAVTAVASTS